MRFLFSALCALALTLSPVHAAIKTGTVTQTISYNNAVVSDDWLVGTDGQPNADDVPFSVQGFAAGAVYDGKTYDADLAGLPALTFTGVTYTGANFDTNFFQWISNTGASSTYASVPISYSMAVTVEDPNSNVVLEGSAGISAPATFSTQPYLEGGEDLQYSRANMKTTAHGNPTGFPATSGLIPTYDPQGVPTPDWITQTSSQNSATSSSFATQPTWDLKVTFLGTIIAPVSGFAQPPPVEQLTQETGWKPASIPTIGQITVTYSYTYFESDVIGDPQFSGFQGQQYQVHGIPDEHFNLISTPDYYINSKFVYIANGYCTYNETACFSHPGTYLGQVALIGPGVELRVVAGTHDKGLQVFFNGKPLTIGSRFSMFDNETYVHVNAFNQVTLELDLFTIRLTNSDNFVNMGIAINDAELLRAGATLFTLTEKDNVEKTLSQVYPNVPIHGLVGQTWRNVVYPHQRLYQGEATDYQTSSLTSSDFLFSQYRH